MEIFLYFAGLAIGICAFFYILSALTSARNKLSGKPGNVRNMKTPPAENIEPGSIAFRKRPALPPGTRICPVCGWSLSKYEGLYAFKVDVSNKSKIMIMGCKYCYKADEDSEKPRSSMI